MSKLSKNILYNLVGQGLLAIIGFVAIKFIFKGLGEDALGIIYFSATLNSIICTVLEMGICSTTVREVSGHLESEPNYTVDLIRTFSLFYWVFYAIAGVGIFFLAPVLVEKWIILKEMNSGTAIYILRIMGIASLTALPKSFYTSLFQGLQRMEFNNSIDVIISVLQQFGTILILTIGGDLFVVVYWYAACYGFGVFVYLCVLFKLFPAKAMIPGYSPDVVKKNIPYASRMTFVTITGALHAQVDKACISKLLPVGALGYYGFTYGVVSRASLVASAVSKAGFPLFSACYESGDQTGLKLQYRNLQDLLCYGSVPILAAVPFFLLPIFSFIFSEEIAWTLLLPSTFLCIGFYMNGTLTIPYVFSLAVGRPDIAARQHFYNLFITVPLTILLVYYNGLIGASISMVVFYLFNYIYSLPRICSECLAISFWKWYLHVLRALLLATATYGTVWIILVSSSGFSLIYLVMGYLLATVAFLVSAYFMIGVELRASIVPYLSLQRRQLTS